MPTMQRLRSMKSRPDLNGRSRSAHAHCGVELHHAQLGESTRDAQIAASTAFLNNQGRYGPDLSMMQFPGGSHSRAMELPYRGRQPQTEDQPPQGSIRFVHNRSLSANNYRPGPTCMDLPPTPGPFETPQRDPAKSGSQSNPQNTGPSDSNYSRYTSSLPNTPSYNRKNINKTWSGPQPWKKENPREPASAGRGRTNVHCNTAPRRTHLSQRHWNQPPPRNRNGTSSATASSGGGGSFRKTMDSSDFEAKLLGQTHPDNTGMFVGAAMSTPNPEMSSATTSRSYLRASRKRSFSFSSNDEERFSMPPSSTSQRLTLHAQPSSLRSQRNAEKGMRKSLRQFRPPAQRPSILPPPEAHTPSAAAVAAAIEMSGNGGEYFVSNTGSLRRSASRMSKRVRSKLKGF